MEQILTPRELNARIKRGQVYWLIWKDGSCLRVYKALSRYGCVELQTVAGWITARHVECNGLRIALRAIERTSQRYPMAQQSEKPHDVEYKI
jgi:hypothetical protein